MDLDIWNQVHSWARTIELQLYKYFSYQFLAKSISKFKDQFHSEKKKKRSHRQTGFLNSGTQILGMRAVFQDQHTVSSWIKFSRLFPMNFWGGAHVSSNWQNDYHWFYCKNFWHPLQITTSRQHTFQFTLLELKQKPLSIDTFLPTRII